MPIIIHRRDNYIPERLQALAKVIYTLLLVNSEYKAYGPPPRGYDGKQTFTFKPLKTADTRILFSNVNDKKPTEFDSIIYDIHIKMY